MAPQYQIYALKFAERDTKQCQFFFREPSDATLTLHFYLWVILGGPHPVVVDTGFSPEAARRREARSYVSPAEMLARVGIKAAEAPVVLVSHLHWDHWDGYQHFPGARFWIQREEVAFWTGFAGQYATYHQFTEAEALADLVRLNYAGRVRLVEGEVDVLPGVRAHWVGGHTAGLQIVSVPTAQGPVVLTSDASHFYRNIERRDPVQIITSLPQMLRGFDRIDELAGSPARVVTGHDPEVARRFDEVEPGIIKIA
ncbi:MAG TPA: N-acyl homoserine lactonase family protein [Methylomirabilota bacterium]|nr:N-acyl homoserine lactonase family protein [Methylomirabilota bacterium]